MATPTPPPVRRAAREIGEHFVAWRKLRGLTIEQVADRAGVSVNTVRRLDRLVAATDPLSTDVGRLRAGEQLPQRVRHPKVSEDL
jgi:transposase